MVPSGLSGRPGFVIGMLLVLFALSAWGGFCSSFAMESSQPQQIAPPDDEIVLIDSLGFIRVVDPYTPPALQPVSFHSASGGWRNVVLGDVNGDGDLEIIARRANQIRVFDPVVPPGSVPASWHLAPPEGDWTALAAGDVDGDGQAEIVAAHSSQRPGVAAQIMVFDPNAEGTSFRLVFSRDLDIPVKKLAVADVDGDGWADVVVIGDVRALFYAFQGGMWDTLFYRIEPKPWVDLVVGQTHADTAQAEIAVLQRTASGKDEYRLYRWLGGGNLYLLDQMGFDPEMTSMATYDMNGDGDDELLFVRPDDAQVPILVRNPAGYVLPRDIQIWGGPGWKRIAAGDLDGDGRGEIVVLKETAYRIYTEPERSDAFTQKSGAFSLALAVGNLDGPGIPVKPVLHLSATQVTFHYQAYTPPPAQAVIITNVGGGGPIAWQAEVIAGKGWLSVTPTSGTTPGTLAIQVDPYRLQAGSYEGRVEVRSPTALESPGTITVTLTVVTPVLDVQPRSVAFDVQEGHSALNRVLAVQNTGVGGAIGWHARVAGNASWLSIDPTTGHTPTDLVVTIDPTKMKPGLYVGNIGVEADDPVVSHSPVTVTVVASIRPPVMQVVPNQVYLNVRPNEIYDPPRIDITQKGLPQGHAIHWVAGIIPSGRSTQSPGSWPGKPIRVGHKGVVFRVGHRDITVPSLGWVQVTPWHGTTPGAAFIHVDNAHMAPGVYYATIIVDGGEGTENRFQGVDLKVVISAHRHYFPVLTTYPFPW